MSAQDIQYAWDAISKVRECAYALGVACAHEQALEDERPAVKQSVILHMMAKPNPLTSTADKPKLHSASSAEAVVETDAEYMAYRVRQRAAVIDTQRAWGNYEASKLAAQLRVQVAAVQEAGI